MDKSKQPQRSAKVFDLSWETEDEPDEVVHVEEREPAGDDVESHGASGFNRPSEA